MLSVVEKIAFKRIQAVSICHHLEKWNIYDGFQDGCHIILNKIISVY
jgi:hypothetical protein